MPDLPATPPPPAFDHWDARLDLAYARQGQATIPVRRIHAGPLRVQKHLYPEDPALCQHILVHPPGGIAGGDRLHLDIALHPQAQVLLTTPGAAKWYRVHSTHQPPRMAEQQVHIQLADGAVLEWLPQETILFNGAQARIRNRIELTGSARLLWLDVVCLGRTAAGERFAEGRWQQHSDIWRDGRLLWHEALCLHGSDPLLEAPIGLGSQPVVGTLLWLGPPLPDALLAECRALPVKGRLGISQLPDVLSARVISPGTEAAMTTLRAIWAQLRPWALGRQAVVPRIWRT